MQNAGLDESQTEIKISRRNINNLRYVDNTILVAENESESCSVVSGSLRPHGLCRPWNSPGQNIGMGSLSLFQGIFPNQGSNSGLPHCRQILYQLNHQGSEEELKNLWWGWKKRVKSWLKTQHSKYKDHGIWSHHFMSNRRGKGRSSDRLYFLGFQDHCRQWLQPWN